MKPRTLLFYGLAVSLTLVMGYVLLASQSRRSPADSKSTTPASSSPKSPSRVGPARRILNSEVLQPEGPPLELDQGVWDVAQADEQVNIRVYEAANRGVVNITTAATRRGFFEDSVSTGSGSGFVLDNRGYILTNYHVLEGAEAVQVGLFDGSSVDANFVGADPSNDVAVLKIEVPAEKLWPLTMGDSSGLKVGQKVLALGNPFGLERTLTTGVISSLERSIEASNGRTIKGIIQTDAAINPGNSGGPLLNSRGQVIGMNTAIFSKVGQSAGISFAVPIAHIRRVLEPLIRDGKVVRADIGIRRVYGLDEGLLIVELAEGGPAERAGLRAIEIEVVRRGPFVEQRADPTTADVIVAVEGVKVRTVDQLLTEVEAYEPGKTIIVTVQRRGRAIDVPVTLGRSS
jgi:S1-C subfamily serine protease